MLVAVVSRRRDGTPARTIVGGVTVVTADGLRPEVDGASREDAACEVFPQTGLPLAEVFVVLLVRSV